MGSRAAGAMASVLLLLGLLTPAKVTFGQSGLSLPAGFHASVYASGLSNPTALAVGPDRRLYVAQQNGLIVAIGSGGTTTIASGFATPLGLVWQGRTLY